MTDIVERLRSTANWMKEEGTHWKDATCVYDRTPFEAADEIERLRVEVEALTQSRNNAVKEAGKVILDLRAELADARELLRSLRSVVMEDYRHHIDAALKEKP